MARDLKGSFKETPEEIKYKTGWEKGADTKWRHEVPDIEVKLDRIDHKADDFFVRKYKLPDIIEDKGLFTAYPEMKNIKVQFLHGDTMRGIDASWNDKKKLLQINSSVYNKRYVDDELKKNISHELQHAIQDIEGFASGTNAKRAGNYDKYFRTAGEVEARNVESRIHQTPEMRRSSLASYTESVPRHEQIFVEGKGASHQALRPEFAGEIDLWDGKTDKTFTVGSTSEPLKSIGVRDKDIIWHSRKIGEILNKHEGMTRDIVKQVPDILENPIVVLKSKTGDSRLSIFGEIYDDNGAPVTAILELLPTDKGLKPIDLNIIASAYGKDTNPAGFIKGSDVLYIDPNKNRADNWFQGLGLQLPSDKTNYGSMGNIEYSKDKINIKGVPFSELMEAPDYLRIPAPIAGAQNNQKPTNNIENFDFVGKGIKFGKNGNFNDEQESSFNNKKER